MVHLTLTGFYAGTPICGGAKGPDDTGMHYSLVGDEAIEKMHKDGTLCPGCYSAHIDVSNEE